MQSHIVTTNRPIPSFFTGRMPLVSPNQQFRTLYLIISISFVLSLQHGRRPCMVSEPGDHVGSGVERTDKICVLAICRKGN